MHKADLLVFSEKGVFFNKKIVSHKSEAAIDSIQDVLTKNAYSIVVISLTLYNLRRLLSDGGDIIGLVEKYSPGVVAFIFGSPNSLAKLKGNHPNASFFYYPRPGVNKLTRQFKKDLLDYLQKSKQRT